MLDLCFYCHLATSSVYPVEKTDDIISTIQKFYDDNITDEFIPPIICQHQNGKNIGTISDGDAVICFNYRTDRCREITTVLTQQNMPKHEMNKMDLHFTTMTNYDDSFLNVGVIFENYTAIIFIVRFMKFNFVTLHRNYPY